MRCCCWLSTTSTAIQKKKSADRDRDWQKTIPVLLTKKYLVLFFFVTILFYLLCFLFDFVSFLILIPSPPPPRFGVSVVCVISIFFFMRCHDPLVYYLFLFCFPLISLVYGLTSRSKILYRFLASFLFSVVSSSSTYLDDEYFPLFFFFFYFTHHSNVLIFP